MKQYAKRKIDLTFNYGNGPFGEDKGEDVTLSGLRVSAGLAQFGAASGTTAQFKIFGLPLSMMNKLTRIGTGPNELRINNIMIAACDEGGAMSVAHQRAIATAYADFNGAPEVVFEGLSYPSLIPAMRPVNARSYSGAVDAAQVMSDLAGDMKVVFENNGVSVMLNNPYFSGTSWTQVQSCATAARINYSLDRGILAIWNRSEARTSQPVLRIASDTGMVGYPAFNSNSIRLRTLFNPDVALGLRVDVHSEATVANGKWVVSSVFHTLESETPNGAWFTDLVCKKGIIE